jgi:hypothetical protein
MVEGWKGQDAEPDRLWGVAIREPGGQPLRSAYPPDCFHRDG